MGNKITGDQTQNTGPTLSPNTAKEYKGDLDPRSEIAAHLLPATATAQEFECNVFAGSGPDDFKSSNGLQPLYMQWHSDQGTKDASGIKECSLGAGLDCSLLDSNYDNHTDSNAFQICDKMDSPYAHLKCPSSSPSSSVTARWRGTADLAADELHTLKRLEEQENKLIRCWDSEEEQRQQQKQEGHSSILDLRGAGSLSINDNDKDIPNQTEGSNPASLPEGGRCSSGSRTAVDPLPLVDDSSQKNPKPRWRGSLWLPWGKKRLKCRPVSTPTSQLPCTESDSLLFRGASTSFIMTPRVDELCSEVPVRSHSGSPLYPPRMETSSQLAQGEACPCPTVSRRGNVDDPCLEDPLRSPLASPLYSPSMETTLRSSASSSRFERPCKQSTTVVRSALESSPRTRAAYPELAFGMIHRSSPVRPPRNAAGNCTNVIPPWKPSGGHGPALHLEEVRPGSPLQKARQSEAKGDLAERRVCVTTAPAGQVQQEDPSAADSASSPLEPPSSCLQMTELLRKCDGTENVCKKRRRRRQPPKPRWSEHSMVRKEDDNRKLASLPPRFVKPGVFPVALFSSTSTGKTPQMPEDNFTKSTNKKGTTSRDVEIMDVQPRNEYLVHSRTRAAPRRSLKVQKLAEKPTRKHGVKGDWATVDANLKVINPELGGAGVEKCCPSLSCFGADGVPKEEMVPEKLMEGNSSRNDIYSTSNSSRASSKNSYDRRHLKSIPKISDAARGCAAYCLSGSSSPNDQQQGSLRHSKLSSSTRHLVRKSDGKSSARAAAPDSKLSTVPNAGHRSFENYRSRRRPLVSMRRRNPGRNLPSNTCKAFSREHEDIHEKSSHQPTNHVRIRNNDVTNKLQMNEKDDFVVNWPQPPLPALTSSGGFHLFNTFIHERSRNSSPKIITNEEYFKNSAMEETFLDQKGPGRYSGPGLSSRRWNRKEDDMANECSGGKELTQSSKWRYDQEMLKVPKAKAGWRKLCVNCGKNVWKKTSSFHNCAKGQTRSDKVVTCFQLWKDFVTQKKDRVVASVKSLFFVHPFKSCRSSRSSPSDLPLTNVIGNLESRLALGRKKKNINHRNHLQRPLWSVPPATVHVSEKCASNYSRTPSVMLSSRQGRDEHILTKTSIPTVELEFEQIQHENQWTLHHEAPYKNVEGSQCQVQDLDCRSVSNHEFTRQLEPCSDLKVHTQEQASKAVERSPFPPDNSIDRDSGHECHSAMSPSIERLTAPAASLEANILRTSTIATTLSDEDTGRGASVLPTLIRTVSESDLPAAITPRGNAGGASRRSLSRSRWLVVKVDETSLSSSFRISTTVESPVSLRSERTEALHMYRESEDKKISTSAPSTTEGLKNFALETDGLQVGKRAEKLKAENWKSMGKQTREVPVQPHKDSNDRSKRKGFDPGLAIARDLGGSPSDVGIRGKSKSSTASLIRAEKQKRANTPCSDELCVSRHNSSLAATAPSKKKNPAAVSKAEVGTNVVCSVSRDGPLLSEKGTILRIQAPARSTRKDVPRSWRP